MGLDFIRSEVEELRPRISVIGVGGAGGNAIANMIQADVQGVDFVVANTDAQSLNHSMAERKIQLGPKMTQGLGAGARPEIGKAAAEEVLAEIERALEGAHMCFIAAGMGGGTGTGAAPVIAKAARDKGILTVGVVTKPFSFEGQRRMRSADNGIDELQQHVDTLIVIPNQNLFRIANPNTTFKEAFVMADEVLQQGVRGITDLMVMPGLINLDFADVRSVMSEMGKAMMGTGEADGDNRAISAAEQAIANPLLDGVSMKGAKGVIISITGGEDMRLMEVDEAANHIKDLVDPDANIIWGSAFNNDLGGKIRVSVVATGIDAVDASERPAAPAKVLAFTGSRPAAATPEVRAAANSAARDLAEARTQPDSQAPEPRPIAAVQEEPGASVADLGLPTEEEASDELLLGEVDMLAEEASANQAAHEAQHGAEPTGRGWSDNSEIGQQEGGQQEEGRQSGHGGDQPEAEERPVAREGGGTLFERMSNIARGAAKAQVEEEGPRMRRERDPLDIPRFLNRQNNQ